MADNVNVETGFSAVVASDDVGGAQYQRMKIGIGSDGEAVDLQPAHYTELPIDVSSTQFNLSSPGVLYGFAIRLIDAGGGSIVIRDGDSNTDSIVVVINLLSYESVRDWFGPQGIRLFNNGMYIELVGPLQGTIWHSPGVVM